MIRNKHGIRMKPVKGTHLFFNCYEGRYKKYTFQIQEWNDDPFGPIPDYYVLKIFNRVGDEIFRQKASDKKICDAEKAVNVLCSIIDIIRENSYKKGEQVS